MFCFLAGVRTHSTIPPIAAARGLPEGAPDQDEADSQSWLGDHSHSWLSLDELKAFDYDQPVEGRHGLHQPPLGMCARPLTTAPGGGQVRTYRALLGDDFFSDLAEVERIGAERVVFGFGS